MGDRRERQAGGGFAGRLRHVVDAYGSANSLAKAIDRSEGAVRKWLRGESEPNVTDLRTLCDHTNTNIEWLVSGRGSRDSSQQLTQPSAAAPETRAPGTLNHGLLEAIIAALELQMSSCELPLGADKRAMLVVTLYELFRDAQRVEPEAVARLIKLAR